jgi:DNA polymerase epsilon subunit 2
MGMEEMSKDILVRPAFVEQFFKCSNQFPENFDALADLIAAYPLISRSTHFLFVPGPLDITINTTLPRSPLLSSLVGRLKTKVPKAHFGTNPCRIKFFDQEIVIFREDLMARMLRNVVGVKPDVKSEDLKRFVSFYWKHLVVLPSS